MAARQVLLNEWTGQPISTLLSRIRSSVNVDARCEGAPDALVPDAPREFPAALAALASALALDVSSVLVDWRPVSDTPKWAAALNEFTGGWYARQEANYERAAEALARALVEEGSDVPDVARRIHELAMHEEYAPILLAVVMHFLPAALRGAAADTAIALMDAVSGMSRCMMSGDDAEALMAAVASARMRMDTMAPVMLVPVAEPVTLAHVLVEGGPGVAPRISALPTTAPAAAAAAAAGVPSGKPDGANLVVDGNVSFVTAPLRGADNPAQDGAGRGIPTDAPAGPGPAAGAPATAAAPDHEVVASPADGPPGVELSRPTSSTTADTVRARSSDEESGSRDALLPGDSGRVPAPDRVQLGTAAVAASSIPVVGATAALDSELDSAPARGNTVEAGAPCPVESLPTGGTAAAAPPPPPLSDQAAPPPPPLSDQARFDEHAIAMISRLIAQRHLRALINACPVAEGSEDGIVEAICSAVIARPSAARHTLLIELLTIVNAMMSTHGPVAMYLLLSACEAGFLRRVSDSTALGLLIAANLIGDLSGACLPLPLTGGALFKLGSSAQGGASSDRERAMIVGQATTIMLLRDQIQLLVHMWAALDEVEAPMASTLRPFALARHELERARTSLAWALAVAVNLRAALTPEEECAVATCLALRSTRRFVLAPAAASGAHTAHVALALMLARAVSVSPHCRDAALRGEYLDVCLVMVRRTTQNDHAGLLTPLAVPLVAVMRHRPSGPGGRARDDCMPPERSDVRYVCMLSMLATFAESGDRRTTQRIWRAGALHDLVGACAHLVRRARCYDERRAGRLLECIACPAGVGHTQMGLVYAVSAIQYMCARAAAMGDPTGSASFEFLAVSPVHWARLHDAHLRCVVELLDHINPRVMEHAVLATWSLAGDERHRDALGRMGAVSRLCVWAARLSRFLGERRDEGTRRILSYHGIDAERALVSGGCHVACAGSPGNCSAWVVRSRSCVCARAEQVRWHALAALVQRRECARPQRVARAPRVRLPLSAAAAVAVQRHVHGLRCALAGAVADRVDTGNDRARNACQGARKSGRAAGALPVLSHAALRLLPGTGARRDWRPGAPDAAARILLLLL